MMTWEEMRARKKQLGYSNAKLAELTGISLGTLNKILSGESKNPRHENLVLLELALGEKSSETWGKGYLLLREEAPYGYGKASRQNEKKPGDYTIEDYYRIPDERRMELIDGVFYDMSAPTVEHQLLIGSVYGQIRDFIRRKGENCVPLLSPVDVKLDQDDKTMVQPDVIVVCDREKLHKKYVEGGPDFVMEVVSPSSVMRDYVKKAGKYMEAGVREYWIADPEQDRLTVYDFSQELGPQILPLAGLVPMAVFAGELSIDLSDYKGFGNSFKE